MEKIDPSSSYAQRSQLFRNVGGQALTEISASAGSDFQRKIVGREIAIGDYDGDGAKDLLTSLMMRARPCCCIMMIDPETTGFRCGVSRALVVRTRSARAW